MIIVAGHLLVEPDTRAAYLADCASVVERARRAEGCLDFALSADPLDPARIDVFERWESRADVEAFRGTGPTDAQRAAITGAEVAEYEVAGMRRPG
ncbi:MAG: antibiotic biosynthesis monooxygenase [Actinobacteria bacterium]|nr:antibiotic biosynthesis monooxygenase [Actinomycetota bacterium]